jgi:DNA-binding CsgD family transcriptional regulator
MTLALLEDSPIGRKAEFQALREMVGELAVGRGGAVYVEGEPGIGKTALVRAAVNQAVLSGCQVFWATCDELSQAFPLVPLLEALVGRTAQGATRPDDAEIAEDGVTVAVERLLANVDDICARAPAMLVVDDIQWGDPTTVQTVGRLARSVHQIPLLVVAIARPVPRREDLVALRRAVPDRAVVQLSGLSDGAVANLVAAAVGGTPGPRLLRLARGAGGNPLYLTELLGALDRSGALTRMDGRVEAAAGATPASLTAAIGNRLEFLPAAVRDVLRIAALLGVEFSAAELAVVSGQPVNGLLPVLDDAMLAGVLVDDDGELAFRHPLIHAALYHDLPAAVRAAWQRDAARDLAAHGAPTERVARQLLASLDHVEGLPVDEWAVTWLIDTGRWLVAHAPDAAIPLMRWAVAGLPPTTSQHDLLVCRLADALYRQGEMTDAAEVASRALGYVSEPGMIVDLHWTLSLCRMRDGRSAEYLHLLRSALGEPTLRQGDRARLLVLIARAHRSLGELDAAVEAARQALDVADPGDRHAVAWALAMIFIVHGMRGETDEALPVLERALMVAEGDPSLVDLRLLLRTNQAALLGDLDKYESAINAAEGARRLADDTGNAVRAAQAESVLGELFFEVGRWDDALADLDLGFGSSKNAFVGCMNHGVAAAILFHRAEPAADRHLAQASEYAARLGDRLVFSYALAQSLERQRADAPREALDALVHQLSGAEEIEETADLLPDAVHLAVSVGDLDTARAIVAQAEELTAGSEVPGRRAVAPHCRGLFDRDPTALLLAAKFYEEAGRVLPRAQAIEAAGLVYAELGALADARKHFTEAFAIYTELGAAWDLARMQAIFRTHGIRRGPRERHRKARSGWDSLTATEAKVAALVAKGMSNPQIAAEMFLSRRTVQTHVSHILAKLNLTSRIDIAREAARRG